MNQSSLRSRSRERSQPQRCAYCHSDEAEPLSACEGCGTALHEDCWRRVERCPTLGCAHARRPAGVVSERAAPSKGARFMIAGIAGLVLGFLLSIYAIAFESAGGSGIVFVLPFLLPLLGAFLGVTALAAALEILRVLRLLPRLLGRIFGG